MATLYWSQINQNVASEARNANGKEAHMSNVMRHSVRRGSVGLAAADGDARPYGGRGWLAFQRAGRIFGKRPIAEFGGHS